MLLLLLLLLLLIDDDDTTLRNGCESIHDVLNDVNDVNDDGGCLRLLSLDRV
mgnify:CR=1 FL=1